MSYAAITAVLARTDLVTGQRLVALSLASFTNREERAFPGNAAAAARAGLGRSRYLEARHQLVARGLVAIEEMRRGRGQATTVTALFAECGPWWDGEINARLLRANQGTQPGPLVCRHRTTGEAGRAMKRGLVARRRIGEPSGLSLGPLRSDAVGADLEVAIAARPRRFLERPPWLTRAPSGPCAPPTAVR